jgi:hypothetical protein
VCIFDDMWMTLRIHIAALLLCTWPLMGMANVKLGTFLVEVVEDKVVCSWSARTESSTGQYYIQKSANGMNWETVGRIDAKGPGMPDAYYVFKDGANRMFGHYRLLFKPQGGIVSVLATEQVNHYVSFRLQNAEVQKEPRQLHLEYLVDKDKKLILRLYDQIGQQVYTTHLPSGQAGIYNCNIPTVGFRKGNYLVVITQEDYNLDVADFRVTF